MKMNQRGLTPKKASVNKCSLSMPDEPIRILHLSDLHLDENIDVQTILQPLIIDIEDADGGLGFNKINYLIISGDFTRKAKKEEFEKARIFISKLLDTFDIQKNCCILTPGNHDQNWDCDVYQWKSERLVDKSKLKEGCYVKQGDIYLIRNEEEYPNRFCNFSDYLYKPIMQSLYNPTFDDQAFVHFFDDTGILFLVLNSCWEIDEFNPKRAGIHEGALARGLEKMREKVKEHKGKHLLRIGVWHHPVTGNDKIINDAFMTQLRKMKFRLVLHGHTHEERADLLYYQHKNSIHAAGAGSFGTPMNDRPESTPRLYNLIEIASDHSLVRVHTRCRSKKDGAWEGWCVWETDNPNMHRSYYEIHLVDNS